MYKAQDADRAVQVAKRRPKKQLLDRDEVMRRRVIADLSQGRTPRQQEEASLHAPEDPWKRYRIGERKMRFPKLGRRDKDFTRLEYNDYVTLTGIPSQAQGYSISGRSQLEWIIDRYHVKTDKASGIVNDPNDFLRERGRPDAVVDLIKRLVTVSMRTQELLATLPALEIPEGK